MLTNVRFSCFAFIVASFLSIYNTNSGQPLSFVVPCALPGQYDLFVQSKFKAMTIFEADIWHPEEHWNLWSNSTQISAYATAIHTQNQMRRRQMIIKWDKRYMGISTYLSTALL